MVAGKATDANVGADTLDPPLVPAARMSLAQRQRIAQPEGDYQGWPMPSSVALIRSRSAAASRRAAWA